MLGDIIVVCTFHLCIKPSFQMLSVLFISEECVLLRLLTSVIVLCEVGKLPQHFYRVLIFFLHILVLRKYWTLM